VLAEALLSMPKLREESKEAKTELPLLAVDGVSSEPKLGIQQ
jgi:hypothetical protein